MQGETGTSKMSSRNITQKNKEVDTGLFGNFGLQIVKDGHKSVLKHLIVTTNPQNFVVLGQLELYISYQEWFPSLI